METVKVYSVRKLREKFPNIDHGVIQLDDHVIQLYGNMAICDCAHAANGRKCAHIKEAEVILKKALQVSKDCIDVFHNGDRLYYYYNVGGKNVCTCKGYAYTGKCKHTT